MKAFIIYLPERQHSVEYVAYMQETLQSYGIKSELFSGIDGPTAVKRATKERKTLYPYSIKNQKLSTEDLRQYIKPELFDNFIKEHSWEIFERQRVTEDDYEKMSRPGVIGCFYSHYELWKKCIALNEPIMIFEDDVKFYREYQSIDFEDVLVLSLGKTSFMRDPQKTYLENPSGPTHAVPWKNFSMPGASGYAIKPQAARGLVKHWKPYWYPADNAINQSICTIQLHTYLMGRNTLPEEGNISMTKSKDWVCK